MTVSIKDSLTITLLARRLPCGDEGDGDYADLSHPPTLEVVERNSQPQFGRSRSECIEGEEQSYIEGSEHENC